MKNHLTIAGESSPSTPIPPGSETAAMDARARARPAVIFECVGVPGVIDSIMAAAPGNARIVVVGVCMERDHIEPLFGINKELNIQFVLAIPARNSPPRCIISPKAKSMAIHW